MPHAQDCQTTGCTCGHTVNMPIDREKELYSQIEGLRSEIERLGSCLRGCRIMLRDGYGHAEVIDKIGQYLGEHPPTWPKQEQPQELGEHPIG